MKVILTENVRALGNVGDLVSVSQGFGRNFLIPQSKAVLADEKNKQALEDQKRRLSKKINESLQAAKDLAAKIEGTELEYTKRVAANGKLFGTVSANEMVKSFEAKGISVEKRQLVPKEAIKSVGDFEVLAKLFTDVEATFKVKVIMDPAQIEEMQKKQAAAEKRAIARKEEAARKAEAGETDEDGEATNEDGESHGEESAETEVES